MDLGDHKMAPSWPETAMGEDQKGPHKSPEGPQEHPNNTLRGSPEALFRAPMGRVLATLPL